MEGHSRTHVTYLRIKKLSCWKGLKSDVTNFVQQCNTCQQTKPESIHPARLLHPLPVPVGASQDISIDFVERLPKSKGSNTVLVVVDRFSKYAHFILLTHPISDKQMAQSVLESVVHLHGMLRSIVSDHDRIFTGNP
jgi:hypothetical protein